MKHTEDQSRSRDDPRAGVVAVAAKVCRVAVRTVHLRNCLNRAIQLPTRAVAAVRLALTVACDRVA